jgi:hypothetical protein
METLAEASDSDYLAPQIGPDGALWYIRRPYVAAGYRFLSPWRLLLDTVLFPIRLARALIHFFNFFSLVFARKPLLTAGGPERTEANAKHLMLWGKMIDAEKAMKSAKSGGTAALVPKSWQLVRQVGSTPAVIAQSVLSFDLCGDGTVVYSDGSQIFHRPTDPAMPAAVVCEGKFIERVIAAG